MGPNLQAKSEKLCTKKRWPKVDSEWRSLTLELHVSKLVTLTSIKLVVTLWSRLSSEVLWSLWKRVHEWLSRMGAETSSWLGYQPMLVIKEPGISLWPNYGMISKATGQEQYEPLSCNMNPRGNPTKPRFRGAGHGNPSTMRLQLGRSNLPTSTHQLWWKKNSECSTWFGAKAKQWPCLAAWTLAAWTIRMLIETPRPRCWSLELFHHLGGIPNDLVHLTTRPTESVNPSCAARMWTCGPCGPSSCRKRLAFAACLGLLSSAKLWSSTISVESEDSIRVLSLGQ